MSGLPLLDSVKNSLVNRAAIKPQWVESRQVMIAYNTQNTLTNSSTIYFKSKTDDNIFESVPITKRFIFFRIDFCRSVVCFPRNPPDFIEIYL